MSTQAVLTPAGHVLVAIASSFAVLLVARFVTALATGAFWAVSAVVATRAAGPAVSTRAMGVVNAGGMLATVLGVPLGAFAGQLVGWRGTFWGLAVLALAPVVLIACLVPDQSNGPAPSIRAQLTAVRSRACGWC